MIIEGKTKILAPLWPGAEFYLVTTKDDITAGDGAKHDVMVGKAELSTRTTCNVFDYLKARDVPMAYVHRDGPTTFVTKICKMIPVEVVVRHVATGSYLKRHPDVADGTAFDVPVVEFFFKTTGRKIGDQELPCDDPLMVWADGGCDLCLPNKPLAEGYICRLDLSIPDAEDLRRQLEVCENLALSVGVYLRNAWQLLEGVLYDFKLEFGTLPDGTIVLADVVDCDSWRVKRKGVQLSKQGYRDGDDLNQVLDVYSLAASLTDRWVES